MSKKRNKNIESAGLSEYIKSLFEKNSPTQIIPVRMNKKRALRGFVVLNKMADSLDILMDSPDESEYSEYQEAIRWMKNEILKRYSISEMCL